MSIDLLRSRAARRWAAFLTGLSLGALAQAATYAVDDSGTVVSMPVAQMRWRHPAPTRMGDNTVDGSYRVDLQLNLANWVGHRGRLFQILAPTRDTPVRVSWTTQGRLLAGSMRSGERVLIYDGPITTDVLRESMAVTLEADGSRLPPLQTLQFSFEIEASP